MNYIPLNHRPKFKINFTAAFVVVFCILVVTVLTVVSRNLENQEMTRECLVRAE